MPGPILSSVHSNLTNYTVRVFREKQMVSYQAKVSAQLWKPKVQYSNLKTAHFNPQPILYPHATFL
jgi:hypothetical protein